MASRAQPDSGYKQTIRELRLAFGRAIAAALARQRLSMRALIARSGISRTVFYDFLGGGPPSIRLLEHLARGMGQRLSIALVPAGTRAREAAVDPADLAILRGRGVAGMRLIEAIGQFAPVDSDLPSIAEVRRVVAASTSFADAARRLDIPQDWVRRTVARHRIPLPFTVRTAAPRLSAEAKEARLAQIRDGIAVGRTLSSIAAEFDLTSERVRQLADAAGLLPRNWRSLRSRTNAIAALAERGVAPAEIARRLRVPQPQVQQLLQQRRAALKRVGGAAD